MTNKEILEGTKLIAEFMGVKITGAKYGCNHPLVTCAYPNYSNLKYHSSWDWLMPVIDKIESLKGDNAFKDNPKVKLQGDHVEIFWWALYRGDLIFWKNYTGLDSNTYPHKNQEESRILALFRAVVEFLKWYNENKSKSI